jgi:hypothetical protein
VFFVVSAIDYIVTLKVVEDKARSAGGKGGMGRMGRMGRMRRRERIQEEENHNC